MKLVLMVELFVYDFGCFGLLCLILLICLLVNKVAVLLVFGLI